MKIMDRQSESSRDTDKVQEALEQRLIDSYGVLLGGQALLETLGIGSYTTLRRQISQGKVGCPCFQIPGRRGYFALASDIAAWLAQLRSRKPQGSAADDRSRDDEPR